MIPPVVQPGDEFQRIRMPNAAGASGKSLRIVSVSGNLAQFEWVDGVAMEDLQAALANLIVAGPGITATFNPSTVQWTISVSASGSIGTAIIGSTFIVG